MKNILQSQYETSSKICLPTLSSEASHHSEQIKFAREFSFVGICRVLIHSGTEFDVWQISELFCILVQVIEKIYFSSKSLGMFDDD